MALQKSIATIIDSLGLLMWSEQVEDGWFCGIEQVGKVMHVLMLAWLGLEKLDCTLSEILQQNNVVFADLVVHFTL